MENGSVLLNHLFPIRLPRAAPNSRFLSFKVMNLVQNSATDVRAEWLAQLLRIVQVPGSSSARRPAILTEAFRGFLQFL
jgi:hypothetical protein